MICSPTFRGTFGAAGLGPQVLSTLAERVKSGKFLPFAASSRNRYAVTDQRENFLQISSVSLLTTIAVGLNDIRLQLARNAGGGFDLQYEVSYWGWVRYCLVLGLIICCPMVVVFFIPAVSAHLSGTIGLVLLGNLLFWSLGWPFILAAMHKPVARRLLIRILQSAAGGDPGPSPLTAVGGSLRYESEFRLGGLPLLAVATGADPASGESRGHARGILAVGDIATGWIALGGIARGGMALGGVSIGAISVGGCSLGLVAVGGLAVGGVAVGGLAIGLVAMGGLAIGLLALGGGAIHPR